MGAADRQHKKDRKRQDVKADRNREPVTFVLSLYFLPLSKEHQEATTASMATALAGGGERDSYAYCTTSEPGEPSRLQGFVKTKETPTEFISRMEAWTISEPGPFFKLQAGPVRSVDAAKLWAEVPK